MEGNKRGIGSRVEHTRTVCNPRYKLEPLSTRIKNLCHKLNVGWIARTIYVLRDNPSKDSRNKSSLDVTKCQHQALRLLLFSVEGPAKAAVGRAVGDLGVVGRELSPSMAVLVAGRANEGGGAGMGWRRLEQEMSNAWWLLFLAVGSKF